jgi:hypothetical protein
MANRYQGRVGLMPKRHNAKLCPMVIRVYDDAGNVIETHEQAGEFKGKRQTIPRAKENRHLKGQIPRRPPPLISGGKRYRNSEAFPPFGCASPTRTILITPSRASARLMLYAF